MKKKKTAKKQVIDLQNLDSSEEVGFEVHHLENDHDESEEIDDQTEDSVEEDEVIDDDSRMKAVPVSDEELKNLNPTSKVKVRIDRFVNLIATHKYEEVIDDHINEEIVISTDLLADLANAHEDHGERRFLWYFLLGLAVGVLLFWILT